MLKMWSRNLRMPASWLLMGDVVNDIATALNFQCPSGQRMGGFPGGGVLSP